MKGLLISTLSALLSVSLIAQQTGVRVEGHGQTYSIQVLQTTQLSEVLQAFCDGSSSNCDGIANAASVKVARGTFSGDWGSLVSKMLEGTQLNYVATQPSLGHPGQIIVSKLPTGNPGSLAVQQSVAQNDAAVNEPAEEASVPPSPDQSNFAAENSASSAVNTGLDQSTNTAFAANPAFSSMGQGATVLPFPDGQGRPIPVSGETPRFLPLSDSQGNPIPVAPVQNALLPIRDANGNPIPVQPQLGSTLPLPVHPPSNQPH